MNTKRHFTAAAIIAAIAIVLVPQAEAGPIEYVTNGSFEQLSGPGQPTDWNLTAFWTVNTGFAEDGTNSLSTNCSGPSFGCVADITQTLSDVTGQSLSGSLWYLPGTFGTPNNLSVLINGGSVLNVSDAVSTAWLEETFSFTATGSDQLDINVWNTPGTSFIDNVSVTGPGSSTPEPSAAILLPSGMLVLLLMLHRRRFRAAETHTSEFFG